MPVQDQRGCASVRFERWSMVLAPMELEHLLVLRAVCTVRLRIPPISEVQSIDIARHTRAHVPDIACEFSFPHPSSSADAHRPISAPVLVGDRYQLHPVPISHQVGETAAHNAGGAAGSR